MLTVWVIYYFYFIISENSPDSFSYLLFPAYSACPYMHVGLIIKYIFGLYATVYKAHAVKGMSDL